jgi:hypothetical protein
VSISGVLLSKDRIGFRNVMVNGTNVQSRKKACQFSFLGAKRGQKISSYAPMEVI